MITRTKRFGPCYALVRVKPHMLHMLHTHAHMTHTLHIAAHAPHPAHTSQLSLHTLCMRVQLCAQGVRRVCAYFPAQLTHACTHNAHICVHSHFGFVFS